MPVKQTKSRQIQLPIDTISRIVKCTRSEYTYRRDSEYGWVIRSFGNPFMYLNDEFDDEAVSDITKCLNLAAH